MKKVAYLMVLMFSLVVMNTSCTKEDTTPDQPTVKTLAQQYPDWTNATWVSTTLKLSDVEYPQISFTIVGNTVTEVDKDVENGVVKTYTRTYDKVTLVSSSDIKFYSTNLGQLSELTFTVDEVNKTITCSPVPSGGLVYTLHIN